jgi:hypothetical protein
MFKRRWLWIISFVLIVCTGWYAYRWLNSLYEIPTDAEQMILYSLYSMDGGDYEVGMEPPTIEKVDRHPVLGKVEIVDQDLRKRIMAALIKGKIEHNHGPRPACFFPRHAIHIVSTGRTIDYVICYECESIEIIEGNRKGGTATTKASLAILNKTLNDAGVPLSPYYSDTKKRK